MKGEDRRRKSNNYPALQACGGEGSCLRACSTNCFSDKTPFFPFIRISILHVWRLILKRKYFLLVGECCHSCWRWLQSSCSRWKQCWWWLGNYYDIDDDELQKCLLWRWWLQYSFTADDDDCAITCRSAGEDLCWPKLLMGSFPPELPLSLSLLPSWQYNGDDVITDEM